MANIEFIKGDTRVSDYGLSSTAELTPLYAIINGKKCFVRNFVNNVNPRQYGWAEYERKKSEMEVERAKESLIAHDGKYITFRSLYDNPLDFLNWIKKEGYTLEMHGEFFFESSNKDFTDFHGNAKEYSCAFMYRIYDEELLNQLKEVVSTMKWIDF